MAKTIQGSPNVAVLDSKIVADLCLGKFFVDVTPSIFIGGGASSVLGAKIKITNPAGVAVKAYGGSYDIMPPMTAVVEVNIPTQNNTFQYGNYTIEVQLVDGDGTAYFLDKVIYVCAPNLEDKRNKFGNVNVKIEGRCGEGKVIILVDEPPVYKGVTAESKILEGTVDYPTGSTLDPIAFDYSSFSVKLFEGGYLVKGNICATYNFGDFVYANVPYKINCKKNILCSVDFTCVFEKLQELSGKLDGGCNDKKRRELSDVMVNAISLVKIIELGTSVGQDVSKQIDELELLLDCRCTCNTNAGTPIINNPPLPDAVINGCNVTVKKIGLTDVYQIDNYEYVVQPQIENNLITVTASYLDGCTKIQYISFDIRAAYEQILGFASNENEVWADDVINPVLDNFPDDLLAFLGLSDNQWNAMSFRDRIIALVRKQQSCCDGSGDCPTILPPDLISNFINNADCPFNLGEELVQGNIPAGLILEFHVDNDPTSGLATNPTVGGGTFYAFYRNEDDCYSLGNNLTVVCNAGCGIPTGVVVTEVNNNCSAPINLLVQNISGNGVLTFEDGTIPASSYLVKRRLASDPDVNGSYTTLAAPVYNASESRWELEDTSYAPNTLYAYKVESECNDGSRPSAQYEYAYLGCPLLGRTPATTSIAFNFTDLGGDIDKYIIRLYNASGTTVLQTKTKTEPFGGVVADTFTGLTTGTDYRIRVSVYIGDFFRDCISYAVSTL